jgi:hypothetical protein
MILTMMEIVFVGVLSFIYWGWDTSETRGESAREVELKNRELDNRNGAQLPPPVVNLQQVELLKRNVPIPNVPPDNNPSRYQAELSLLLDESASRAGLLQPMRPNRLEEYGTSSWRTAGKVLTDSLYFKYPREGPKAPSIDWTE